MLEHFLIGSVDSQERIVGAIVALLERFGEDEQKNILLSSCNESILGQVLAEMQISGSNILTEIGEYLSSLVVNK